MKIAYLGKIQLSDVDLSYLHEAQKLSDITLIMEVSPRFMRGPAFNINTIYPKSGIFKAVDAYPAFQKYHPFINTEKFYVVNTCGKLWQLKSFWTHFLLLLFLIRHHFTVIHLVWPPNIYEMALYWLRRKMILTVHDPFPHTGLDTFIVRLRRKIAFKLVPRLVILNKAQRQPFLDYYHLKSDRVVNSRLSCYTYLQTITPDYTNVPEADSYILFAGKISPYKGLDYLLPAIRKMHETFPQCRLIVAGSGAFPFDITAYQQLDYLDIRNRFIPDKELVALMRNAAFVVCPYTDATQSGVIMSAFAFCKPVLATNVGGLPEMVRHEHYGLIIQEKNVDALAAGMSLLWENHQRLEQYASELQHAYQSGVESWGKIAEELRAEYVSISHNNKQLLTL